MSFDRKNKRAAQAALREANHQPQPQQQHHGAPRGETAAPQAAEASAGNVPLSGIGRSLKDGSPSAAGVAAPPPPPAAAAAAESPRAPLAQPVISGAAPVPQQQQIVHFIPPPSVAHQPPPPIQQRPIASPGRAALTVSDLSPMGEPFTPAAGIAMGTPPPSAPPLSMSPRSSVAAQVMMMGGGSHDGLLSGSPSYTSPSHIQHAGATASMTRRLSTNNGASAMDSLSPSRHAHFQHLQSGVGMMGTSPSNTAATPNVFGTSPFSSALFMPSSYDSVSDNGGGFLSKSPPPRLGNDFMPASHSSAGGGFGVGVRRGSSTGPRNPWSAASNDDDHSSAGGLSAAALGDDDSALAADDNDDFDESSFLPSSLNDLLTPDELEKRKARVARLLESNSQSVPNDVSLALSPPAAQARLGLRSAMDEGDGNAAVAPPRLSNGWPSAPAATQDMSSNSGTASSMAGGNSSVLPSLLSISRSYANVASNSAAAEQDSRNACLSPHGGAAANALMGPSSLPGGLAAGLSRLHLEPARHSGETPPGASPSSSLAHNLLLSRSPGHSSHQPSHLAPRGTAASAGAGNGAWNGQPISWSSQASTSPNSRDPSGLAAGGFGNAAAIMLRRSNSGVGGGNSHGHPHSSSTQISPPHGSSSFSAQHGSSLKHEFDDEIPFGLDE